MSRRPPTAATRPPPGAGRTGPTRRFARRNRTRRCSSICVIPSAVTMSHRRVARFGRVNSAARSRVARDAPARRPAGSGADTTRGPATASTGSASSATSSRASPAAPASRMSCQSVTSSDDRRLYRIRIRASAIDASHAATVRITIVKTWPGPVAVIAAEADQGQRRPLEHHLGREEHHDQVPPRQEAEHAQRQQRGPDQQVVPAGCRT